MAAAEAAIEHEHVDKVPALGADETLAIPPVPRIPEPEIPPAEVPELRIPPSS